MAGVTVLPEATMPGERLDTSEAATTFVRAVLASLVWRDSLPSGTARDDKEAAQTDCLFCNLTNGESLEPFL